MVETHFQKELEELKENLLKMAAMVEEAMRDAVQSLVKRDSELAAKFAMSTASKIKNVLIII